MKKIILSILIIVFVLLGIYTYKRYVRNGFNLPNGGNTISSQVTIQNGQIVEDPTDEESFEIKDTMITDGLKHSVDLDDIIGGGPPKDGIPSIDNPKFINVLEAEKELGDQELGIAVTRGETTRFYPFQILVWHEIVNDTIEGDNILVTYCPLCFTGIVFEPLVNGQHVEFGTSGKLWNSNLVMYDRLTNSLWSQVLGEAIVGEMTGTILPVLPFDIIEFGKFKQKYSNAQVLSKDTGAVRFYGSDPYGDYYTSPKTMFPLAAEDDRLEKKDLVLGIVIDGKAKAYYPPTIKEQGEIVDQFASQTIIGRYDKDLDIVRLYKKENDGTETRLNPFSAFWFSWVAAYPQTELLN